MRRLRAAGIFTQIAIAPMLPNHPQRFADLAAENSDRVIVDTYFDGDGARGRRSRALGIGELYERLERACARSNSGLSMLFSSPTPSTLSGRDTVPNSACIA
jgi:DNA repair photolyase